MTTHRIQVGLHLDADVIEALRAMTAVSGVPASEFMRRAVARALADYREKGSIPQASQLPAARRKRAI